MKILAYLLPPLLGLSLSGCLYANKCGLSQNYYDEKTSYYDSQGNYIEECPETVISPGDLYLEF